MSSGNHFFSHLEQIEDPINQMPFMESYLSMYANMEVMEYERYVYEQTVLVSPDQTQSTIGLFDGQSQVITYAVPYNQPLEEGSTALHPFAGNIPGCVIKDLYPRSRINVQEDIPQDGMFLTTVNSTSTRPSGIFQGETAGASGPETPGSGGLRYKVKHLCYIEEVNNNTTTPDIRIRSGPVPCRKDGTNANTIWWRGALRQWQVNMSAGFVMPNGFQILEKSILNIKIKFSGKFAGYRITGGKNITYGPRPILCELPRALPHKPLTECEETALLKTLSCDSDTQPANRKRPRLDSFSN